MKLYYFPGACSLADHIVLEWTGLPHQTVRMSLESLKSPDYLALNPNGTVPLLVDGDFALNQNAAILCYLAEQRPELQLLGDGTLRGRAEVMDWLGFLNSDVHFAFKPLFNPARFLSDPDQATAIADTARAYVRILLGRIDRRLASRDWLTGRRSVADPYLFVMFRWAVLLNVGVDGLANLARFSKRMYADIGVRKAIVAEGDTVELAA
jgi:glutathione S-transferase